MTGYPMLLDLTGRRVLVVGGGPVAARRARGLADAGAQVVVVTIATGPQLLAVIAEIDRRGVDRRGVDRRGSVTVTRRAFEPTDVDGAWLVVACTDDSAVNEVVSDAAARRQVFCVRADAADAGSARTSAVVRRDGVTVAVNGGDDPRRAVALRNAIALALDQGRLPTRAHRDGRAGGSVALVGGGPGDPELITVRGRRLVAEAEVLVIDRLAPRALLETVPATVEVIDCGKSAHRHNLTQDEINAVLVDRALAGKRVVRLKGGDPFVFGRGGEEWLACVAAGVAVTVVPGLSSALAAPAAAGIPLTHRGLAADFTVVSGHLDPGRAAGDGVDWPGLASHSGTLVLLMAMDRLGLIAAELISHGKAAGTPAAVVHRATSDEQTVVRGQLDSIADAAERAGIGAPAVVVIGDVVNVLA